MPLALPRFIVLASSKNNNKYLGYAREDGKYDGYLRFMETQAVSPYAKFEVEMATSARACKDGVVHIRSCQNNKYWVRVQNALYWIAATANKPEEDQSKESCTLFEPVSVDPEMNTVRFRHVQSKCYLCFYWWEIGQVGIGWVMAIHPDLKPHDYDIFKIIDWDSLLILPKYVAFKGDNHKYLCLRQIGGDPYLQFAADDIGDSTVACEVFVAHDGNIRIKPICSNKFRRRSPNWIWADCDDSSNDTLFRPVKVDNKTIGLVNLGNNNFCKRLTTEGKTSCLNAAVPSVTREAQLRLEEPILTRDIYNVKYSLDNARVYDETVLVVTKNSASNYGQQSSTLDVKLAYTDSKTSTWNTMFSLKLGMKAGYNFGIPLISNGNIELSSEVQSGVEWGETKTSTTVLEVVHRVVVPPMTKVTVNLIATKGKCDVPFTFRQRDALYNGTVVITEVDSGTYTGSNYYNIQFQTQEENMPKTDPSPTAQRSKANDPSVGAQGSEANDPSVGAQGRRANDPLVGAQGREANDRCPRAQDSEANDPSVGAQGRRANDPSAGAHGSKANDSSTRAQCSRPREYILQAFIEYAVLVFVFAFVFKIVFPSLK